VLIENETKKVYKKIVVMGLCLKLVLVILVLYAVAFWRVYKQDVPPRSQSQDINISDS